MNVNYFYPATSVSQNQRFIDISSKNSQLKYSGFEVVELAPGDEHQFSNTDRESIVVPLNGGATVDISGKDSVILIGRPHVWTVTDVLYVPVGSDFTVKNDSTGDVKISVAWATAKNVFPVQYIAPEDISVELRGAGVCSRQVNNFGTPGKIQADRLIACEVLTPGGNWSSYPPHKHDVATENETILEELYYFQVAKSPAGTEGFGLQRVYASEAGEIDVTVEVRNDDMVVIPFGYHGPSIAAPGHDLYYLNVMAGPERKAGEELAWKITDDADHTWLREQWNSEEIDPRLPFGQGK